MVAALSREQVAQFQAFGHLHLPSVFTPAEVTAMRRDMEAVCTELLGRRPTEEDHINQQPFCELSPALTPLVADGRILGPVEALLGESYLWAGSTGMWGFSEEGLEDHLWHADSGGASEGWADDPRPALFIKAFIYLDKQTRDTGALRVLPGSHRGAYHRRLLGFNDTNRKHERRERQRREEGRPDGDSPPLFFGTPGRDLPCHVVESNPGDLVLATPWCFHAVYGKVPPRRTIILKFLVADIWEGELARRGSLERVLHPSLLASEDAAIRRLVDRVQAHRKRLGARL